MIRLSRQVSRAIEHGHTLVVPSRQRSEAVRLAQAAQMLAGQRRVWRTPDVLPLDTWLTREIEKRAGAGERIPRLLTPAEDWLIWRQCTAERCEGLDLVARGPLSDALRRASGLAAEFGIDVSNVARFPGSEERVFYDVERAVAARRQSLGATTAGEVAARMACPGGARDATIAGFDRLTPRLDALITRRGASGCITEFLTHGAPQGIVQHARAVEAADAGEELERIADWCHAKLRAQPDARLLVLAPGAPEAREQLVTLIRQNVDARLVLEGSLARPSATAIAAIEGGAPLSRSPLAAHALMALTWLTEGCEFAQFSAWLCAPHWAIPMADRARLDLWLRERASLEVTPRRLLAALDTAPERLQPVCAALAKRIGAALEALEGSATSPREWSERISRALQALQILRDSKSPRRALTSAEAQTHDRFAQLLDELGGLSASLTSMPRDAAVRWLGELASRTSFQPATGDPLVTVSSQLADPIVRYDGIWVCGLHADAWPAPVQPDPFLPLSAQISAGVPAASAAGRAAEARALMNAWAEATDDLVLSAPLRDDDVQLSPSPLVMRFARREEKPSVVPSPWLPLRLRREGLVELIDDPAGPQWPAVQPLPSGTRSLELQNLCPFRAYAELRLGSVPLEAPEPGVAPDVRGQLLHKALEKVWSTLRDSTGLASRTEAQIETLVAQCVEEAANEVMGPPRASGRAAAEVRECRRAVRLICSLCVLERKRAPFAVQKMEHDDVLRLAGAQLRLRIDRLDALASGGVAILDYKSGRPITGDWYSARPSHPQLLAYLAAVGSQTVAMATVSVTAREIRFDGVAQTGNLLPKVRAVLAPEGADPEAAWATRQAEWIGRVERLITDFLEGQALVDPRPKACEYCHVAPVCRISDTGPDAVERNVGE